MLDALHHRIHRAAQERDLLVKGGDQLAGLVQGKLQAVGELGLAHAIHQAQADGLGSLALDAGHVRDHLVKVGIGVIPIRLGHLFCPRQVQQRGVVDQQSRLLRGEVVCRPKLVLLRQEQASHQRPDHLVARGHLLQVGVGSRQPACDRAAVLVAHLVEVGVDAPIGRAVLEVRLQECAVGLVQLAGLHDHLGHRVVVGVQKALGEAGRALRGPWVLDREPVEGLRDAGCGPDVHLHSGLVLDVLEDALLLAAHLLHLALALSAVEAHALERDVHQHRQHLGL